MSCSSVNKNLGEVSRHDAATSCRLVRFPGKLPEESGATTPRNPSLDAESGGSVLTKRKGNGESRPTPAAVLLEELSCHRRARRESYGMPASTRPAAPPSARTEKERARLLAAMTQAAKSKQEGRDG